MTAAQRVLMIGEAPSKDGDPSKPLTGRCMLSLLKLSGLSADEYLDGFERMNLLAAWPGKVGKGDAFPIAEARTRATALMATGALDGRRVVLWGWRLATAFGMRATAPLRFVLRPARGATFDVAVLPHPSGVNRWWNDPDHRIAGGTFLKLLAAHRSAQRKAIA